VTSRSPTPRELRISGVALSVALAGLCGLKLLREGHISGPLLGASALVAVIAVLAPSLLRGPARAAAAVTGWSIYVTSRATLVLVYFFLVTPLALVGRLFGARFADVHFAAKKESYWVRREASGEHGTDFDRQY